MTDQGLRARLHVRRGAFALEAAVDAAPGEVVGVLGPNGAGKTTLLRALAGLEPLTGGSLRLAGRVLDEPAAAAFVPPHGRRVALVFQDHRLFPHLSARDNVAFAARSAGAPRRAARAAAQPWLERLDAAHLADRRPHQLSGGQAQRVALARALAAGPELLLLDEPLAALDAGSRLAVRAQLPAHLALVGAPALVVTHDPVEALVVADRLLVLEAGRVVQAGPPAEVARRPATAWVAQLVGLNLYRGTVAGGAAGGGAVTLDGGGAIVAHGLGGPGTGPGARVLVALRPAAVAVHATRPAASSPRNAWPGTVAGLEPLPDRVRLRVDGAPPALVDLTPAAVAELRLRPGSPVWLTAKATDVDAYPAPPS